MKPVLSLLLLLSSSLSLSLGSSTSLARPLGAEGRPAVTDWARELAPAQSALAQGDHAAAYARFQRAASRNPLAQFMVGLFHRNGWGRPVNPPQACTWFEKAAHRQVPAAEHLWGDCLAEGIGRPADVPGALAWYEAAARHGHLISWCSAAGHLLEGKGVPRDVPRGLALCEQAAQANSPPAMRQLANFHAQAHGDVPPNLAAARGWYLQAAQRGVAEAQHRVGLMMANGEGGPVDLEAALFWLESASAQGHAPAYLATALLYAHAPVQPDTGAQAPEHLAKVYLWTTAAVARSNDDPELQAQARSLQGQALAVMPASWRPDLDKQVAEHLAEHAAR